MQPFGNDFQSLLNASQQSYGDVLSGYANLLSGQSAGYGALPGQYNALNQQVQGTISGVEASQRQAIADTYAQQQGGAQQQLINSGLGNSTVLSSVNRGLGYDAAKANVALANQTAQLKAGYQAQFGLAGLQAQQQGLNATAGIYGQQLGYQAGVGNQYLQGALSKQPYQQQGFSVNPGGYGGGGGNLLRPPSMNNPSRSPQDQGGYTYGGDPFVQAPDISKAFPVLAGYQEIAGQAPTYGNGPGGYDWNYTGQAVEGD